MTSPKLSTTTFARPHDHADVVLDEQDRQPLASEADPGQRVRLYVVHAGGGSSRMSRLSRRPALGDPEATLVAIDRPTPDFELCPPTPPAPDNACVLERRLLVGARRWEPNEPTEQRRFAHQVGPTTTFQHRESREETWRLEGPLTPAAATLCTGVLGCNQNRRRAGRARMRPLMMLTSVACRRWGRSA
jgi:hypothetical protein